MGAWGTGLYDSDDAADVRETFRDVARLPVEPGEVVDRLAKRFGMGAAPTEEDEVDFWLALADQLHRYGIDHAPTMDLARRIVTEGHDLRAKRDLDMSDADLKKRAKVLEALVETWAAPHPKPKAIRKIKGPETFLFEAGDVWIYPTMEGSAVPFQWHQFDPDTIDDQFRPDGWGAFWVLERWHHDDFFARYLIALAMPDGKGKPGLEDFQAAAVQGMTEAEFYLDDDKELQKRPRTNRMIFSAHVNKPSKAVKMWRAERIGALTPDPETARARVSGPLAESFLASNGLASMEHLLTVSGFHNKDAFTPEDELATVAPLPDLHVRDLMRIEPPGDSP